MLYPFGSASALVSTEVVFEKLTISQNHHTQESANLVRQKSHFCEAYGLDKSFVWNRGTYFDHHYTFTHAVFNLGQLSHDERTSSCIFLCESAILERTSEYYASQQHCIL